MRRVASGREERTANPPPGAPGATSSKDSLGPRVPSPAGRAVEANRCWNLPRCPASRPEACRPHAHARVPRTRVMPHGPSLSAWKLGPTSQTALANSLPFSEFRILHFLQVTRRKIVLMGFSSA